MSNLQYVRDRGPFLILAALSLAALAACSDTGAANPPHAQPRGATTLTTATTSTAVLGGGCFWCLEAYYERLDGVGDVISGYAGGETPNPTYEQVGMGRTNHAEVVQIPYDAAKISYRDLLEIFFTMHDPTTPNRQGADVGTQYRSIILFANDEQRRDAEAVRDEFERNRVYDAPIVTEIKALETFHPAEGYHQNYFENNPNAGYCRVVISPKVSKLRAKFADRLKPEYR